MSGGAAERLRQIESVTDVEPTQLDVEEMLDELLERVRQLLDADTAAVLLLDPSSSELVATAARGIEEEVRQGVRVPLHRGFAGRIAAEGRPVVLDRVDETTVVNPLLAAKGIRSMAGVPLIDAGTIVGVLHVGSLSGRPFTDHDVDLLQVAADRVTAATRPRLAVIERSAAVALQRGLLPAGLLSVPGLDFAARYVPGGGNAVGGDWYDVFRLGGGRLGVVIGDVSGHGLNAAIVMGRTRSALRAYALESGDPAEVLSRLDNKLQHFEAGEMATVLYAVLDPTFERLHISCAGHLPPLRCVGDGVGEFLELDVDPPLGVRLGLKRHSTVVDLPADGLLCLYTDGLVEQRGEVLDSGLQRLREVTRAGPAEAVCAEIMGRLVGAAILEDDVALLVIHRRLLDAQTPLELQLRAESQVLGQIRSAARRWLSTAGATPEEVDELLLAVGEASSNVVEHAYGPDGGELYVRFERAGSDVTVTVRDQGKWRAPRGSNRGRGTLLMERCTDEVEVARGPAGTTVTLRKALGGAAT